MPASKHRRKGKSRQRSGPVRPHNQRLAEAIWDKAADWDWTTRQKGRHGGIIGRSAMQLLRVLLFVNWVDVRPRPLELTLDALANIAEMSRTTLIKALHRLGELGMLDQRESRHEGRRPVYVYTVLPPSRWARYREPAASPSAPGTEGDHPLPPL